MYLNPSLLVTNISLHCTQYESETFFLFFRKLISETKICHNLFLFSRADTSTNILFFEPDMLTKQWM